MTVQSNLSAPEKKKWWKKHFGLKTLLAGIIATTVPFISLKTYEGKPRHPPKPSSRYVEQDYQNLICIRTFKTYQDLDNDGVVDEITRSVSYPDWMYAYLPQKAAKYFLPDSHKLLEIWARGVALKGYPDSSVQIWHITPPEQDLEAKAVFDDGTKLFQKYYASEK